MNTTDLMTAMASEAKTLRGRIQTLRDQRDSLTASIERDRPQYEVACGYAGHPTPEAEDLFHQLSDFEARLARGEEERRDAERRLDDLDRALGADEAAAAATKAVQAAQGVGRTVAAKIEANDKRVEKMVAMRAEALDAVARARAQAAAAAVAALPEAVRELLPAPADAGEPAGDDVAHEVRAQAIGEAIEKAEAIGAELQRELAAAREAEEAAAAELLHQRAYQHEVEHAVALASYLKVLATFRASHEVAFGFAPELPDYKRHADESHGPAMQAAREAARPKLDDGLMRRVGRLVQRLR